MQAYCYLQSPKVEWEAEPSAIRLLSHGTIFQFWSGRQTPSLRLRVGLKLSFLIKLIVRADQAHLGSALSYAAIGLDCRGTSRDALSSSLLLLLSICMHVANFISSPEFLFFLVSQETPEPE